MSVDELTPYEGIAARREIQEYQKKIGSVMYIAITTRPDIAFATSRLSRHLTNPGPMHQRAADRVIGYLQKTRGMSL